MRSMNRMRLAVMVVIATVVLCACGENTSAGSASNGGRGRIADSMGTAQDNTGGSGERRIFLNRENETAENTDPKIPKNDDASDVETANRRIIAPLLGTDADDPDLKYFMASLKVIDAGRLQSAVYLVDEYGFECIDIVAEDGTNYRLDIKGYSVWAAQNLDTGEWVIRSYQ